MHRILSCSFVVFLLTGCGTAGEEGSHADGGSGVTLELTPQVSSTDVLLQAVSPVSEGVAWVSGHGGTYARTTDGGATWTARTGPGGDTLQFRDVAAFDSATAYLMSSGTGALSRIYRTDDGGSTWRLQYVANHPDAFLDCMDFWDRDHGLAYGDAVDGVPFILRTDDGGGTWTRVAPGGLPRALEGEGGFAASGTCLVTGRGGWAWIATGNGLRPRVLYTGDRGRSWQATDVPVVGGPSAGLTTLRMGPEGTGIAAGGVIGADTLRHDSVAVTSDRGRTWRAVTPTAMAGPVYGAALADGSSGMVVVMVGPGGLEWSSDLGETWRAADTVAYWAVGFAGPAVGWAVGPLGRITRVSVRRP